MYCSLHIFSQEEEDWLDALEAGELDDFGRLKQERDTSMMTARQVGLICNFSLSCVQKFLSSWSQKDFCKNVEQPVQR